ncbi:acyl-CoA dehydrogenase family protein [Streptomyces albiaxialis]|uniref:Acyl-CoA dehydrogenase family protein n=1 Tax=Streptomyces albiaxialis TaxID=329523 RepID=A0ABP5IM38_9ACTN
MADTGPGPGPCLDFLDDPLFDPRARYELGTDELIRLTARRAKALHDKGLVSSECWRGGSREAEFPDLVRTLGWLCAFDLSLVSTVCDHQMAGSALLTHGSAAQVAAYRDEISRMDRVYAFAVTEIGRGTNLLSLGTEVHYRHEDRSLRVVTPSDDAAKYWIGNTLFSATHAMTLARLVVDGTDEGHHWFRVPLRPDEGAAPFAGVRIDPAGPKGGLEASQTGMIRFDQYRMPVDALMSAWAHIDADGRYVSGTARRERYVRCLRTFTQERVFPVTGAAGVLRRSAAIVLRYSTHREAFGAVLLERQHYRERLMPVVAEALALHHLTEHLIEEWTGEAPAASLYGLTSGAKAYASWAANANLVALRELCGGHGFHSYNEIVTARVDGEISTTFGGDNTVLCYESTRAAAKTSGRVVPPVPAVDEEGLRDGEHGAGLLGDLAGRLLRRWESSQRGALCRPHVRASRAALLLRRWARHSQGATDDALRQLYAVHCLLGLAEHLLAEGLLDGAGVRGLLAQRAALSDRCAEDPAAVLGLLNVPEALLDVPLAHPDYVRRTVALTEKASPTRPA